MPASLLGNLPADAGELSEFFVFRSTRGVEVSVIESLLEESYPLFRVTDVTVEEGGRAGRGD
tara:strand:+ start:768 stop:953 length:186 start_codon:yes stop_codon:yes gene_type:complete